MTLPSERRPEQELPPTSTEPYGGPGLPAARPPSSKTAGHPAANRPARELPPDDLPPPGAPSPIDLEPPAPAAGRGTPAGTDGKGRLPYTRVRAAWVGVWAGLVAVVLLIVFVAQNTAPVRISFLWMEGSMPTALALLIAGVGGAVIAMAVAAARIIQLRRTLRRESR